MQDRKISEKIEILTSHLQVHKKDHFSRRSLMKLVGKRRRIIKYLEKKEKVSKN